MFSIRVLAAAVLASSGLILSTPALAAPKADTAVAPWANAIVLVKSKHRDRNWSNEEDTEQLRRRDRSSKGERTRRDDRQSTRDGDRTRRSHGNWRRDDRRDDRRDVRRDDRRDDRRDLRRDNRRDDRRDVRRDDRRDDRRDLRRSDRRDDRRDLRRDLRRDDRRDLRRNDRGNHYGWYKGGNRKQWRARHHPRHNDYIGRRFPRVQYVVIDRYDDYYLPAPRRGHYYARVDNDVYLVATATKLIIDAFVLLDSTKY